MKAKSLFLFLVINILLFHIQGIAQPSNAKPKVTAKSVSSTSKRSIPTRSPKIQFEKLSQNLGTIKEDAVIEKTFEFVNVGEKDLVIINAKGSCGCTIPTAPTLPIAPGAKGKIMVKYTAKNKVGPQKPTITVVTNGVPSIVKLNMEAWVEQIPGGIDK